MTLHFPRADVPRIARLRVEDFMLLNAHGAFEAYAKSELIEGEIVCMNAQFTRHALAKTRLTRKLNEALEALRSNLEAVTEVAVSLSPDSMPEPDIVLATFEKLGPVARDRVALIIEIADSTVEYDLGRKARIYAAAGIPEYWVLDVENGRLIIHLAPLGEAYADRTEFPLGVDARSATIEGLIVSTEGLVD
jgi:Uma2 family endonuclease